jgi:chitin disaccharide deacetylase
VNRRLVVNADDYGRSPGVNEGIEEGHERGIVTSASLMVRYGATAEAAEYARAHTALSVGLHVDLGEWVHRDERGWVALYMVKPDEVEAEVGRQLAAFRSLIGRDPTHLDSHQHVHRDEPARSVLVALGRELGVPVRHFTPGIAYCGGFYGQSDTGEPAPQLVSAEALIALVESTPEGTTELLCHPACEIDFETTYGEERIRELESLCDPRVSQVIAAQGIELRSFSELS